MPILLTSDDPVVIHAGMEQPHHADCFLTDEQFRARIVKERHKKKRRQRDISRVVHFWSPVPRGVGTAHEIVLAISPSSALVWGPLGEREDGTFERERLTGAEAQQFASQVNAILCAQSLDWIITRPADATFTSRDFPMPGPLLRVCDGTSAASSAINSTPKILRPRRLRPLR